MVCALFPFIRCVETKRKWGGWHGNLPKSHCKFSSWWFGCGVVCGVTQTVSQKMCCCRCMALTNQYILVLNEAIVLTQQKQPKECLKT